MGLCGTRGEVYRIYEERCRVLVVVGVQGDGGGFMGWLDVCLSAS